MDSHNNPEVIASSLSTFDPPSGSQLLTYVDDILVASETEAGCKEDTVALLKHLAKEGHKVSKNKLQFCQEKVKYLGHQLSSGGRTILEKKENRYLISTKTSDKNDVLFGTYKLLQELGTKLCRIDSTAIVPHVQRGIENV